MRLHLPRPEGTSPLILGHRGARARAPENSLAAYELALQEGADGVELDVRMSADGELFVIHDERIRPDGSTKRVRVGKLTSSQLKRLRLEGQPLLTLREALQWGADRKAILNVELKRNVAAAGWMARRATEMVEAICAPNVFISSFDPLIVWQAARALPEVPAALLMYERQAWGPRVIESYPSFLKMLKARGFHPDRPLVTQAGVARRREQGLFVVVWTVNDPDEAERFARWGVDGIITDNPREIVERLRPTS